MWRPEPVAGWPCATVRWSTRTRSSAPPPDLADFRRARPRGAAWRTGEPDASRLGAARGATATFARMADLGYDGRVAIITGAGGGAGRGRRPGPRALAAAGLSWSTSGGERPRRLGERRGWRQRGPGPHGGQGDRR